MQNIQSDSLFNKFKRPVFGKLGGGEFTRVEKNLRLLFNLSWILALLMFLGSAFLKEDILYVLLVDLFTLFSGIFLISLGVYGLIHKKQITFIGSGYYFGGEPWTYSIMYLVLGAVLIYIVLFNEVNPIRQIVFS